MGNQLTRDGVNSSQTRQDYANLQNMGSQYADLAVDAGLAAAGALPPPFGTAADLGSLGRSLWRGDWGGALLDAVGIIPIFGDGAKAAKIADRLNDLRKSIDVTSTAVARAFNQTRATATKYWDDIVQANRQKWQDALAKCGGTQACKDAAALQRDHNTGIRRQARRARGTRLKVGGTVSLPLIMVDRRSRTKTASQITAAIQWRMSISP